MKRKKYILLPIALSIILIVSGLFTAYASGNAAVYADSISANAGQTVRIPIMIKNNSGLAGTKLIFKYDFNCNKYFYLRRKQYDKNINRK